MKQYTGTKTVKAKPMTMGEAYGRKLLKEGVKPSEFEMDRKGYLVKYEDGYLSWSPAEMFEKAYKPSETVLDRLRIERDEVKNRLRKMEPLLCDGTLSYRTGALHTSLLLMQATYMENYLAMLESRIESLEDGISSSLWLSVNTHQPQPHEECIILTKFGKISFGHIVGDRTRIKNYNGWNIPDVEFWMPFIDPEKVK